MSLLLKNDFGKACACNVMVAKMDNAVVHNHCKKIFVPQESVHLTERLTLTPFVCTKFVLQEISKVDKKSSQAWIFCIYYKSYSKPTFKRARIRGC